MSENYSIQELHRLVVYSDYIPGEISKAEDYFDKWFDFNKEEAINNLFTLFSTSNKVHDLCVILQIFSHMEKEDAYPKGLTASKKALEHKNPEVQEYALRCFENWGDPNNIDIIQSANFEPNWLEYYAVRVIEDLEDEKTKLSTMVS